MTGVEFAVKTIRRRPSFLDELREQLRGFEGVDTDAARAFRKNFADIVEALEREPLE